MTDSKSGATMDYTITKVGAKEHRGSWTRNLVLTSDVDSSVGARLSSDENKNLEIMPNDLHDPTNRWIWKIDLDELETQLGTVE